MGYELHITRAPHWTESEAYAITLDEWLAYVASDSEMRLDNFAEAEVGGDVLRYDNDGLAVWLAYSGHSVGGNMAWFDYRGGRIVVKSPDREIVGKLVRIAQALGAQVIGDEGEFY
jgi:hypothetical protein